MPVPYWVQDSIFYQIFPDRFYNSETHNDPVNIQPWGSEPTLRGFQGGDLCGILNKLDYLLDLGVNALYLNPIFASAANHRYHINDYYAIDPTLGTMQDFRALLDGLHRNNMRLILDGVFNHSGRGFFAFNDILENNSESRYKDWYYINGFPIDAFGEGKATTYRAWWDIKDLPKFNTSNPAVRQYLMGVSRYWIEQGVDGWRLDVPAEIDDDSFWDEFRQGIKAINPDSYIVGEIWEVNLRWVGDHHFDGLLHYPWRDAVLDMVTQVLPLSQYAERVEGYLNAYPHENVYAMYLPLGSHDTRRLITKLDNDVNKVKLAMLLQFTYPGTPGVYYGDEIGLDGEKDPYNRKAFPWDESDWNKDIRTYSQHLIEARKRLASLRRGDYRRVYLDEGNGAYAFARTLGEETAVVVIHPGQDTLHLRLPVETLGWQEGQTAVNVLDHGIYPVNEGVSVLGVPPFSGILLQKS